MKQEFHSLQKNDTWELVNLPPGRKLVKCKLVYKTKFVVYGSPLKYEAILVAKGYSQFQGIDYNETFAPVAKMDSIRLALAIAASRQWEVHHMDVKCSFINGDMKEDIYMQKLEVFVSNPSLVCRLKKSLYWLKQSPKAWYVKIDGFLLSLSFVQCKSDPNVYLKLIHGSLMIIVLYVDDLLITGSSKKEIASLKDEMNRAFSMTDLGLLSQFLGLEIAQFQNGIKFKQ